MVEGTSKLDARFDRLLPLTTKCFGSFRLNEVISGDRGEASILNMAGKVSSKEPGDRGQHGCIEVGPLGPDMGTEAGPHAHQERNNVDRGKEMTCKDCCSPSGICKQHKLNESNKGRLKGDSCRLRHGGCVWSFFLLITLLDCFFLKTDPSGELTSQ